MVNFVANPSFLCCRWWPINKFSYCAHRRTYSESTAHKLNILSPLGTLSQAGHGDVILGRWVPTFFHLPHNNVNVVKRCVNSYRKWNTQSVGSHFSYRIIQCYLSGCHPTEVNKSRSIPAFVCWTYMGILGFNILLSQSRGGLVA